MSESYKIYPGTRAGNKSPRSFQNHEEGPDDGLLLKVATNAFAFKNLKDTMPLNAQKVDIKLGSQCKDLWEGQAG